jgi:hypothetical protein
MTTVLETLQALECKGTRADRLVGVHIHTGIPLKDHQGQFTIAPMLGILREYLTQVQKIQGIIPTTPNRLGFIQPIPGSLEELVQRPDYFTNPTELNTILVFFAKVAGILSKKYSALNLDNSIALMIQQMIEEGRIRDGQKIEFDHVGEHFVFRVNAGQSRESYDISWERPGEEPVHLMRIASPDVRKPTIELRIFDTIIDAATIQFWLKFMQAWGWKHGTNQIN